MAETPDTRGGRWGQTQREKPSKQNVGRASNPHRIHDRNRNVKLPINPFYLVLKVEMTNEFTVSY